MTTTTNQSHCKSFTNYLEKSVQTELIFYRVLASFPRMEFPEFSLPYHQNELLFTSKLWLHWIMCIKPSSSDVAKERLYIFVEKIWLFLMGWVI